jgi:hypothetical protein
VPLGVFGPVPSTESGSRLEIETGPVCLEDIPRRILNNVGMVVLTLLDCEGREMSKLNMVMSVDERDGAFYRTIFSPTK